MIKGKELLTGCVKEIQDLAIKLESKYGTIIITSGFRSPEYNKKIGGSSTSQHCLGRAIDVCIPSVSPIKVAAWVLDNVPYINGIGLSVYAGYCHLDNRDGNKTFWTYNKQGVIA